MPKSTYIICTDKRDGQFWRWYGDANTPDEIERAFDMAEKSGAFCAVAAFRNVVGWWEHAPAYQRSLPGGARP